MLLFIAILAFAPFGHGLTFLSPPSINVGNVWASIPKQLLPVVNTTIFNTNVSVVIANDFAGCQPSSQDLRGKVLWNANLFSCSNFGLSQNFLPQWKATQDAGAIGIITSILVGSGDFTSTKLFRGNPPAANFLPVFMIGFKFDWTVSMFSPTNPQVAFNIFKFAPGSGNITVNIGFPDANKIDEQVMYVSSGYGFGIYFSMALCFLAIIVSVFKLAL